jgi:hypothetical protein
MVVLLTLHVKTCDDSAFTTIRRHHQLREPGGKVATAASIEGRCGAFACTHQKQNHPLGSIPETCPAYLLHM